MPACDFCREEKPDASVRQGLHPRNAKGLRSRQPFKGFLCDACLEKTRTAGSPANRWLLEQVAEK